LDVEGGLKNSQNVCHLLHDETSRHGAQILVCERKKVCIAKAKGHPKTDHEGPEGEMIYSFTLSLTSALDWVGAQRQAPAALTPGKTQYPLYRRLGGPQGGSGRVRKISHPLGFNPRTVQPVASHYTD
jgi:hypothetical protein